MNISKKHIFTLLIAVLIIFAANIVQAANLQIKLNLYNSPVADVNIKLVDSNGKEQTAKSDNKGIIKLEEISTGEAEISIISPLSLAFAQIDNEPIKSEKSTKINIKNDGKINVNFVQSINAQGKIIGVNENDEVLIACPNQNLNLNVDKDGKYYILDLFAQQFTVYVKIPANSTIKEPSEWKISNAGDLAWITVRANSGSMTQIPDLEFAKSLNIQGIAFEDTNNNGNRDNNETGIPDISISLQKQNAEDWELVANVKTDGSGNFIFTGLITGQYRIKAYDSPDYVANKCNNIGFNLEQDYRVSQSINLNEKLNLAFVKPASLVVSAFMDENNNGAKGKYEVYVPNILVEVLDEMDNVLAQGKTTNGQTTINGIVPGKNRLRFTASNDYWYAAKGTSQGADFNCLNPTQSNVAISDPISFASGQSFATAAGVYSTSSMSGKIWLDSNNNGIMDNDEPGFANVKVKAVSRKTGEEYSFVSDDTGFWSIPQIKAGNYDLTAELPEGYLFAIYSHEGRDLRSIFTPYNENKATRSYVVGLAQKLNNINIGVVQPGSFVGKVFLDSNHNGIYDQGELGVEGVVLELVRDINNKSLGQVVSNAEGDFEFGAVRQNNYKLRAILPADGMEFTVVAEGDISKANKFLKIINRREYSFGPINVANKQITTAVVGVARKLDIGGKVYIDNNFNGKYDVGEKLVQAVKIRAVNEEDKQIFETKTNAKGEYRIDGLYNGSIRIYMQSPKGYVFVRRLENDRNNYIDKIENKEAITVPIELVMGENNTEINAGLILSGNISGKVFEDANDNGLWDTEEKGYPNLNIELLDGNDNLMLSTKSDANGDYNFEGTMPNTYKLRYTIEENAEFAEFKADGNSFNTKDKVYTSPSFNFNAGDLYQAANGGIVRLGKLSGMAFHDTNGNGIMDQGENPMANVEIKLNSDNAKQDKISSITTENGEFSLNALRPGSLSLSFKLPEGYIFSNSPKENLLKFARNNEQSLVLNQTELLNNESYNIAITLPAGINAKAWLDENLDGKHSPEEKGFASVNFRLLATQWDNSIVAEGISDSKGEVKLDNLRPGQYELQVILPEGAVSAKGVDTSFEEKSSAEGNKVLFMPNIELKEGENHNTASAGIISYMKISGKVWLDNEGEKEYKQGLNIELYRRDAGLVGKTQSDDLGRYSFEKLLPGSYYLIAEAVNSELFVNSNDDSYQNVNHIIESIEPDARGKSYELVLEMPNSLEDMDIIYVLPAKLGDYVWLDLNNNGLVDAGEPPVANVNISVLKNNEVLYTGKSDGNGYYIIRNIYPGTYTLQVDLPNNFGISKKNEKLPNLSTCLTDSDDSYGYVYDLILKSGEKHFNADIAFALKSGMNIPSNINNPDMQDWSKQEIKTNKSWGR